RIVGPSASLDREPAGLPVEVDNPKVTANDLTVPVAQVKTALSAPLHLTLGVTRWNLRPARIARLLELPAGGSRDLGIGGAGASAWFTALSKRVDREPQDATWAIGPDGRAARGAG